MPAFPLGRWYNRLTYSLSDAGFSLFTGKELNGWRSSLGLKTWNGHSYHNMNGKPVETLYAYSRFLAPKPKEWGEHLHVTGFWPLGEEAFTPDNEGLLRFLNEGEKPIYIGFGSMVGGSFEEMLHITLESLKSTGQRAILSSGWRKLTSDHLPPNVYSVDFVPHSWLFPRVKAVVHHGGAGTTAGGLRAGKPTFIVYFGGDQPYWGSRVYESGAGPEPVARRKLTISLMTERLKQLENGKMHENAEHLAAQLLNEDGCGCACDIIENYLMK
jgi:sterol 3beta-glucosyltransferase